MRLAALRIQCLSRCRQARLRVKKERARKALGPEVVEMLRRVVSVSGRTLTAVVYRCGGSYKVVGFDATVQSRQYVGFVYEPEVQALLVEHNKQFQVLLPAPPLLPHSPLSPLSSLQSETKAGQLARVMPWQHR
jgi:hypothetical protein